MPKSIKLLLLCIALTLLTGQAYAGSDKKDSDTITGVVVETMNAGGFTYLCLKVKDDNRWVAVRERKVEVGEKLSISSGPVRKNFTSKALGRTFDEIILTRGFSR